MDKFGAGELESNLAPGCGEYRLRRISLPVDVQADSRKGAAGAREQTSVRADCVGRDYQRSAVGHVKRNPMGWCYRNISRANSRRRGFPASSTPCCKKN
jgi:hypothetical protein